jgi:hypothetical protein
VAAAVAGVPFMSPEQGRVIYDHVRATGPRDVLELGTAHGVGAAYLAAGLPEGGRLTTVDHAGAAYDPAPEAVLARARVADRVEIVREYSSYTWWLKEQVRAASDAAGNCTPRFDFVYLDGSKNWTVDGFAVVLIQHPSFTELKVQDEWWGWARKAPGEPRRLTLETSRPVGALVAGALRRAKRRAAARQRR